MRIVLLVWKRCSLCWGVVSSPSLYRGVGGVGTRGDVGGALRGLEDRIWGCAGLLEGGE